MIDTICHADFDTLKTGLYMIGEEFTYENGSIEFDDYLKNAHLLEFHVTPRERFLKFYYLDNPEPVIFKRPWYEWTGIMGFDVKGDWILEVSNSMYTPASLEARLLLLENRVAELEKNK